MDNITPADLVSAILFAALARPIDEREAAAINERFGAYEEPAFSFPAMTVVNNVVSSADVAMSSIDARIMELRGTGDTGPTAIAIRKQLREEGHDVACNRICYVIRANGMRPVRSPASGKITAKVVEEWRARVHAGRSYSDLELETNRSMNTIKNYVEGRAIPCN